MELEPYVSFTRILRPIVLSSDAATTTKDRPGSNGFLASLLSQRATCPNRYPSCLKLISCVTFHWTNAPLPLLNAVART
jgi:hypothetical protein